MFEIQKFLEKVFIWLAALLLWLVFVLINKTLKIVEIEETPLADLRKKGFSIIYALWHSQTFVPFYNKRKDKVVLLTTAARRGQILNSAVKNFGYQIVHLPGFKAQKNWLIQINKLIGFIKNGYDTGIVLDGPDGPAYQIKPGIFFIASRTGCPIIPSGIGVAKKIKLFWRWDRYWVPRPFTKAIILYGQPLFLEKDFLSQDLEALKSELKKRLDELNQKADEIAKK